MRTPLRDAVTSLYLQVNGLWATEKRIEQAMAELEIRRLAVKQRRDLAADNLVLFARLLGEEE